MQCVILAAGRGTRMGDLTESKPKPLVSICGRTILDHIVEALPKEISELVMVVGYRAEQIREYCGDNFHGYPVNYVEQSNYAGGTGDALFCARDLLKGRFLFMYADDIHGAEALDRVIREEHAMLGMRTEHPERFGVLVQNEDGTLREIIEKPKEPPSNLVNIGGFVVSEEIFDCCPEVSKEHGEVLVTDMLTAYAQKYSVKIIEQNYWIPVGYPEQVLEAEKQLCPSCVDLTR